MDTHIPVIDIRAIEQPATLKALDSACREWGFFQVTGHGIDETLIEDVFAMSRDFFTQPTGKKREILRSADNPWGFYDQELTKNARDWKEIYDFGPADGAQRAPRWPTALPRFEPVMCAYYDGCRDLAGRLLAAISMNLGMPATCLLQGFGTAHTSFLRLNYYPSFSGTDESDQSGKPFGVGEHTDSGALTLLLQDEQPGLEVFKDGAWHLVEPRSDALVVNIGDIVQVWSNDRYKAALHRVITNRYKNRYSVPFFFNPSYDTDYQPLPTTVTAERPARYRPISWREFRTLRAAGDYADFGEEIQISHYTI
jgi:isopenicillin N synthase-like dioxygenase